MRVYQARGFAARAIGRRRRRAQGGRPRA